MQKNPNRHRSAVTWLKKADDDIERARAARPATIGKNMFGTMGEARRYEAIISTIRPMGHVSILELEFPLPMQQSPIIVSEQRREPTPSQVPGFEFADIDAADLETW